MDETLDRAWRVLSILPERELTMMPAAMTARHYGGNLPERGHDDARAVTPASTGDEEAEHGRG